MPKTVEEDFLDHMEKVNAVAQEYLKGNNIPAISKELSMPRQKVSALLKEWQNMAANNEAIHARAREALAGADQHYSRLIRIAYEIVESADLNGNLSAKNNAVRLIVDIEAKRLDMLHRAGLLDSKELADELAAMEKKHEILIGILKDVTSKCSVCKPEVMKRMAAVAKSNEVFTFDA